MLKQTQILRSHHNDFIKHHGWWATMEDPDLRPGEQFEFVFDASTIHILAECTGILRPGTLRFLKGQEDFTDWWIIQYKEVKVATNNALQL